MVRISISCGWGYSNFAVIQCDCETDAQAKPDKSGQRWIDREVYQSMNFDCSRKVVTGDQEKPGVEQPYLSLWHQAGSQATKNVQITNDKR